MARSKPKCRGPHTSFMNIAIHREIRKALKASAVLSGMNMPKKLHEILCREFGREDLIHQVPNYTQS